MDDLMFSHKQVNLLVSIPASVILENGYFGVLLLLAGDMEYSSPIPLLDSFWYGTEHCSKKINLHNGNL